MKKRLVKLTKAEDKVLKASKKHKTIKAVAAALELSETTVKWHRSNIILKMRVKYIKDIKRGKHVYKVVDRRTREK